MGIDDYDVEHAQQEHAVQKIKSAGQSVCLTVQPIPELTELSVRSPDGNETYLLRIGPIKSIRDPRTKTGQSQTRTEKIEKSRRTKFLALEPDNFFSKFSDQFRLAVRGSLDPGF